MKSLIAKTSPASGNLQEDGSISPGPTAAGELRAYSRVCDLLCPSRTLAAVICHSWESGCAPLGKTPRKSILCPGRRQWENSQQKNLIFKADISGKCFKQILNSLILEIVFIPWFIQNNCRKINPHLSMRLLGRQNFVLNSNGTGFFSLKLSKGEGKGKAQAIRIYLSV